MSDIQMLRVNTYTQFTANLQSITFHLIINPFKKKNAIKNIHLYNFFEANDIINYLMFNQKLLLIFIHTYKL